jgi:hypothetical protein
MSQQDRASAAWHKSSYSAGANNCVEVAETPPFTAVRDTQHRDSGTLTYGPAEWRAFLRAAAGDLG